MKYSNKYACLVRVHHFLLEKLPEITAYLDTGYSKEDTEGIIRKMYPGRNWETTQLSILCFRWLTVQQAEEYGNGALIDGELKFSYNWNNKLSCIAFTSIRMKNEARWKQGGVYLVTLKKGKK